MVCCRRGTAVSLGEASGFSLSANGLARRRARRAGDGCVDRVCSFCSGGASTMIVVVVVVVVDDG